MTQPYTGAPEPVPPYQPQYQPLPPQAPYAGAAPQAPYPGVPQAPYAGAVPQAAAYPGGPVQPYPVAPQAYKDSTAAWLLWFFLGFFGAHHFYLGNNQRGVVYAVSAGVSFLLSFVVIGLVGYVVLFVFWIIDATQLTQQLNDCNARAYAANRSLGFA